MHVCLCNGVLLYSKCVWCVHFPMSVSMSETAGVLGLTSTPVVFNELSPCFRIVDFDWGDP